ncbi:MAG: GtrA family protein, partial [bacterium]|nr:GtrA family protein [bacterium]
EMDADGQHDHNKIPEFLKKIDQGFDMVIGTRYSNGGSIPKNWPPQRKAFSIFGNLIVRTIFMRFSIHDWTGGFRALKKEVFLKEKEELTNFKGYTFQVSFLHKAVRDGFKIAEVPFHFTDRTLGDSKIAPKEYIIDLLKYVISARINEVYHSPFMKYAIVGFSGYAINALALEFFVRSFNIKASLAASMGGEISIMWNFTLNNFWSFSHQKITSPLKLFRKFLQFNLISLGSLVIIGLVVGGGTSIFGETPLVRQFFLVIAIGFFIIPYSYTLYNVFIWKRWKIGFLSKLQNIAG